MPRVLGQGRVMYGTVLYHFGDSVLCWDHHHFKEFCCLKVLLVVKPSAILIVSIVVFCHTPFLSALCAALCIMQALGVLQNNFTTIGRGCVCMYVLLMGISCQNYTVDQEQQLECMYTKVPVCVLHSSDHNYISAFTPLTYTMTEKI